MRRFRLVFAGVCLVLLVPLGLVVWRAVASVALERDLRQRAVADRVFDECERALSGLLAAEEARPFGHYGFTWTPPGQVGGAVAVTRSPLSEPPALDFVVGHFQIDPDGSVHTPLAPHRGTAARGGGGGARRPPGGERGGRIARQGGGGGAPRGGGGARPPETGARRGPRAGNARLDRRARRARGSRVEERDLGVRCAR